MAETLKYKELSLHIDVSFWYELERRKLNEWRLDEPVVPLTMWMPPATRLKHQMPGMVTVSADSFSVGKTLANQSRLPATVHNFNTGEQLVDLDKKAALNDAGEGITHGYELTALRAFDLFPNTHHVEAVGTLSRG